jgi:hypothetical protein
MRFEDALIDVYRNFINADKARVFGKEYEEEHTLDILKELGQDEFMKRYEADKEIMVGEHTMYCLNWTLNFLKKADEDAYRELERVKDGMEIVVGGDYGRRNYIYRKDR